MGELFQPKLTAKGSRGVRKTTLGKRKRTAAKSKKAHRWSEDMGSNDIDVDEEEDDPEIDDSEEEDDPEISEDASESDDPDFDWDSSSKSESESDEGPEEQNDNAMEAEEEITEQYLQAKIQENDNTIKRLRTRLSSQVRGIRQFWHDPLAYPPQRLTKQKATDEIIKAKCELAKAQTEKNGICSLKRSEFSRDILKEDFRVGLREIDETEDQERDPASFDPTKQTRSMFHRLLNT